MATGSEDNPSAGRRPPVTKPPEPATVSAHESDLRRREQELEKRIRLARDEISHWRAEVQGLRAACEARAARLNAFEQQLKEKVAAVEADRRRLAELVADVGRRQASADEARRRGEETESQARQHRREALVLREQAEERERESRQTALVLEVERQEIEREKAAVASAEARLDAIRTQRERELDHARSFLEKRAAELQPAERAAEPFPRRWRLRSTVLSVAAAVVTVFVWLGTHPPLYRAAATIRVASESPASMSATDKSRWVAGVLHELRRALLDPGLLDEAGGADALRAAWQAACMGDRVAVTAGGDEMTLCLDVTGTDRGAAVRLVSAAAQVYARQVNSVPADASLPRHYHDFLAWRDELRAALEQKFCQQADDETALADTPRPEERERTVAEADRLDGELADVAAALEQQHGELAGLLGADASPGHVAPTEVEGALAADNIYKEDRREFHAVALKYRNELAVAVTLLVGPLQAVQKAFNDYAGSLAEQRALNPPAELAAVLEAITADVAGGRTRFAQFGIDCRGWVTATQETNVTVDAVEQAVVELVQRQTAVADAVRRLSDDAAMFVDENGARVEGLNRSGEGSTREVVVGAVLRSDHAALKAAVDSFAVAAGKTALTRNVELDTLDRQLRGLQMRLDQRRALVTQQLQLQADRAARDDRAARAAETRDQVSRLEQSRDELIAGLTATLHTVRGLDEAVRRHDELVGRLQQNDADIGTLETQISTLESKLAEARRNGPKPDRVQVGETVVEPVRQRRCEGAAVAGLAALTATWVVYLLLVAGSPRAIARQL